MGGKSSQLGSRVGRQEDLEAHSGQIIARPAGLRKVGPTLELSCEAPSRSAGFVSFNSLFGSLVARPMPGALPGNARPSPTTFAMITRRALLSLRSRRVVCELAVGDNHRLAEERGV
jgi:hypothetical protein